MDIETRYPGRRVAVLIDGDNLSPGHLPEILTEARLQGAAAVRRVYGDVTRLPGWEAQAGFRMVHSGCAKNAADMLLTIDAMQLAYEGRVDAFVIASSDRDFSHLAHHLRERGHAVIGLGEAKTHAAFRKACVRFVVVGPVAGPAAVPIQVPVQVPVQAPVQPPGPVKGPVPRAVPKLSAGPLAQLDAQIRDVLTGAGDPGGMLIGAFGGQMHQSHKIVLASLGQKGWRAYLTARPALYACDPKGPAARVRWIGPSDLSAHVPSRLRAVPKG